MKRLVAQGLDVQIEETSNSRGNSNIVTLVTIIMLLYLYRITFRTLTHLMPEAYSKLCQISKMMRDIENPGIVNTVYSGTFRHIQ